MPTDRAAGRAPVRRAFAALAGVSALLLACSPSASGQPKQEAPVFPAPDRPVSSVVSTQFSEEDKRDAAGEFEKVVEFAGIAPGMTVADIGAGEGYYTVRLGPVVGAQGRVLAQDIDAGALRRLGERVTRESLDNVSIKRGEPDDPMLPQASFNRVLMVHMYHEIEQPYAFLWRLRPALAKGGEVIVVDSDRPTDRHGIPPRLLFCEFEQLGFTLKGFIKRPEVGGYFARFAVTAPRPEPEAIRSCAL